MDIARGRLRNAPTLGWQDLELRAPLAAALKLPVVVENDVKACVLAQLWAVRGHAPVDGPVAFVNASDGVGVGIAIDGQLLRGAHNNAGELGHVSLNMDGPRCACGQKGCWEAYVSVRAIIARYRGTDPAWPASAEPSDDQRREDHRARPRRRGSARSRRCARPGTSSGAASRRSSRRSSRAAST